MMKAKEYAKRFYKLVDDEGPNRAVYVTFRDVFYEAKQLKEQRNVQTNVGFAAILNELENKWQAICRLVPELKPSGFADYIRDVMPDLWFGWKETNNIQKRRKGMHSPRHNV